MSELVFKSVFLILITAIGLFFYINKKAQIKRQASYMFVDAVSARCSRCQHPYSVDKLKQPNKPLAFFVRILFRVNAADEAELQYCSACSRSINAALVGMAFFTMLFLAATLYTIYSFGLEKLAQWLQ